MSAAWWAMMVWMSLQPAALNEGDFLRLDKSPVEESSVSQQLQQSYLEILALHQSV